MATRIATYITNKMLASSVIEEGDSELYCYGFFLLITRFFFFLVAAITGFLSGLLFESIVFYVVFMLLRSYAGGVHARTEAACTVLTTLALATSVFGIKIIVRMESKIIPMLMLVSGSLCILLLCPLDTKEKPLSEQEKVRYRLICYAVVLICIAVALAADYLSFNHVFSPVVCGIFLESVLLVIGKVCNYKR